MVTLLQFAEAFHTLSINLDNNLRDCFRLL